MQPRALTAFVLLIIRAYGTTCASREFPTPPILAAPTFILETKPGWWGAWSPFLVGNLVLTGFDGETGTQGPPWRMGRDGAIYGVTRTGAYKLQ